MNRVRTKGLRALIDVIQTSGMTHVQILQRAGVGGSATITHWKNGRYGATLQSAECVAEAIGYELQWVKK